MDLGFVRKSEEPTLDQLVEAIELSDEELAAVVGGDGCGDCGRRHRRRRCKRWDRHHRCREWGY
jgi:bacteriocin-like protein